MPVEQLTFTVLRPGEGFNPSLNGYQIKGCSSGLTPDERETISEICIHYGGPVYNDAPLSAHDRVKTWVDERKSWDIPDEILKDFPCSWSYVQLGDDRFALTCVRYIGYTKEPRPGNFFGHSLVFSPSSLEGSGFNPLEFARKGWIKSRDTSSDTHLDTLSEADLEPPSTPSDSPILRQEQYARQLSPILCALANVSQSGRPVVLCIADWQDGFPLVDALLNALPPGARRRTTFCTYESDLNWKPSSRSGPAPNHVSPYQLVIQCSIDGKPPRLSPHHYQTHAVFNFIENCERAPRDVSVYSNFAADSAGSGTSEKLHRHHALAVKLGYDRDVDVWNTLVSAVSLSETSPVRPEELYGAVKALVRVASQAPQAQIALEQAGPHLKRLADTADSTGLTLLAPELAALADRLADDDASFESRIIGLASIAFVNGQGGIANALLKACGRRREHLLQDLMQSLPASTSNDDSDRTAIVDLLLEGLQHASPAADELVLTLFAAAKQAGRSSEVWKSIGEPIVVPRLRGEWAPEQTTLARGLIDSVTGDCPEGEVILRRLWVAHSGARGEDLIRELMEVARTAARCSDVERLSGEILQLVKERLSEGKAKGELAEVFGSFAAVTEDTPCYRLFFDAYKEETKEIAKSQKRFELRKKLVERGALRLVSREFFEEVLPWEGDKSRKAFKEWEDRLLRSTPRLLEEVVGQVTQRLKSDAHELGEHFLSKWSGNTLPPAFARLYEAAIMDLPLEPLEPSSKEWVGRIHDQITSETKDRLSILTFLTKLSELSEKRNWSIEEFKSDDPAWSKVRLLPSPAKEKILNDCIGTFTATGITTPSNAAKFESMMAKIGEDSPERIAASLWRLIENRDEVTQVNVARAFAQNHLDRPGGAHWAEIVGALARKFDKNTCRLLTAHLEKGFGRRGDDFDERLQELYATAGLGKPKRTEASRTETTAGGGQSLADRLADAASSLGKIKSKFLEKLMGGSEPTNKN